MSGPATALCLLGSVQIGQADQPFQPALPPKSLAMLGYLVRQARPVLRSTLAALLWPDKSSEHGRANVRWALNKLSQLLPGCFETTSKTIHFRPTAQLRLDTGAFEQLRARDDIPALVEAMTLYRNEFMAGLNLVDCPEMELWLVRERQGWRQQAFQVLERLLDYHTQVGDYTQAQWWAQQLLELEPWHEETHQRLMYLLALSGQRNAALAQFQRCRQLLAEALDVEPMPETVALYEQIRTGEIEPAVKRPSVRTPVPAPTVRHNLPAQSAPFLGREEELSALNDLLDDADIRLITIMGPGGMGKTRLALAAAERQLTRTRPPDNETNPAEPVFPQGIYFVDLTPLRETRRIISTIAKALNFYPQLDLDNISLNAAKIGSLKQELIDFLRLRRLLLVIDNFEHLLDGAGLLSDILKAAPEVQILVTSRERLQLQEEQLYPIQGLSFANPASMVEAVQYPIVRLFLQSALRVQPDFELTEADLPSLTRVCRLVAGMPLGIELAASWIDMLPLAEIADEIERSLDFLEIDLQNVPERHRSIRAVFDYSWQRLAESEQSIFPQLSIFRPGFTRAAAQAVTGASLRLLSKLVSKSLLQYDASRDRYEIHELLRQYGREKLAEDVDCDVFIRTQHSAYFCDWLKVQYEATKSPQVQAAFAAIEADLENIEAAWSWAITNRLIDQIELAIDGMYRYYERQSRYKDDEAAYRTVVSLLSDLASVEAAQVNQTTILKLKAKALAMQARFHAAFGRLEQTEALLGQSEAILADPVLAGTDHRAVEAFVVIEQGFLMANTSRHRQAVEKLSRSLALYQALGMDWEVAKAQIELGAIAQQLNEHRQAKNWYRHSLAFFEAQGNQWEIIGLLNRLGWLARGEGDYDGARNYYQQALALAQTTNNHWNVATCLVLLAYLNLFQGEFETAKERIEQSLTLSKDVGRSVNFALGTLDLGAAHWLAGDADRGYTLLEQSERLLRDLADPYDHGFAVALIAAIEVYRGNYRAAHQGALAALKLGRRVQHPFVIGRANRILGWVALAEGKPENGYQFLQESLTAYQGINERENIAWTLAPLGLAAYHAGRRSQARAHLHEALHIAVEMQAFIPTQFILPATALLLADQEEMRLALDIYGLALSHPFVGRSQLLQDVIGSPMTRLIAPVPADMVETARMRARNQDRWEAARTLLISLEKLGWAA